MMADVREVGEILTFLAALYPRFGLAATTIRAYAAVLEDVPAELLKQAAIRVGGRCTFFPAAAELRNAAFDLLERAEGIPSAMEAWGEMCRMQKDDSRWRLPGPEDWSHPRVYEALQQIGGYENLKEAHFAADRARFLQAYNDLAQRGRECGSMGEWERIRDGGTEKAWKNKSSYTRAIPLTVHSL